MREKEQPICQTSLGWLRFSVVLSLSLMGDGGQKAKQTEGSSGNYQEETRLTFLLIQEKATHGAAEKYTQCI